MARRGNSRRRQARRNREDQVISKSKGTKRRSSRTRKPSSQLEGLKRVVNTGPGREIVHVPRTVRPRVSRAGPSGATVIPRGETALALRGEVPPGITPQVKPARAPKFLERSLGKGGAKLLKGGAFGLLALMELSRMKSAASSGAKRRKQLKLLRDAPEATAQGVLRDRRRGQLLAMRRAQLARTDPEAYGMLLQALSGEQPPRLARGEILLGRQPTLSPTASQDVDALLEALG